MANLKAGTVSGYRSHGPERRADAGRPHAGGTSGSPHVRVPFRGAELLGSPSSPVIQAAGLASAIGRGMRVSRSVQQAQQRHDRDNRTAWTATAETPAGERTTWTATAEPAYGGAAYNGGGGALANALSSSDLKAIAGPPRPGPGVRGTSRPPTSQAQSRAGRDRRARNFKAKTSGPKIIQGTAEDVTPAQPSGGSQGNRGWKIQAAGNRNRGPGGREGPGPTGMYP